MILGIHGIFHQRWDPEGDPVGIDRKVSLEMMRIEHGMGYRMYFLESEWEIHGDSPCRKYQRIDQET